MPTHHTNDEAEAGKNAPYKSARRDRRRTKSRSQCRRITVRSVRRDEPDLRKLARAVIELAVAQAEADAAAGPDEPRTSQRRAGDANDS